jgi:hypothetical protein
MSHYICTGGCNGESQEPGVCDAEFCKKEGELLSKCNCEDGVHEDKGEVEEKDEDLGE